MYNTSMVVHFQKSACGPYCQQWNIFGRYSLLAWFCAPKVLCDFLKVKMIKSPKCYIEIYSKYFLRGQLKNLVSAIYHYIFNYCLKTLPPYTKNLPEDCSSSRTLNQCSKLLNLGDDVSCSLSSMQNGNLFNAKYCIF